MSDAAPAKHEAAPIMGFKDGDLIQELGYDDDVDFDLRDSLEDAVGSELLTEEDHEVVDGIIYWWRDDDGDLIDALVDSLVSLDDDAVLWLLTPKSGRDGYVSPAAIQADAPTAGLHVTSTEGVSEDWSATRLVARRKN